MVLTVWDVRQSRRVARDGLFCAAGRRPIGRTQLRGEVAKNHTHWSARIFGAYGGRLTTREDAQYC